MEVNLLHRLEAREILAHLNLAACDRDVVAHLRLIAEVDVPQKPTTTTLPRTITVGKVQVQTEFPAKTVVQPLVLTEKMIEQGWTQELVDSANRQQQAAMDDYERRKQEPPLTQASAWASGAIPPGGEITVTGIGIRNAVGDECVAISDNGHSVFRCSRCGKGYVEDRPGVKSCTFCLMGGDDSAAVPAAATDGEDSRW